MLKPIYLILVNGGLAYIPNGPNTNNLTHSECEGIKETGASSQSQITKLTIQLRESEEKLKRMEVDLHARGTVIAELETRIASTPIVDSPPITNNLHNNTIESSVPLGIEIEMLQQQLNTLQNTIAKRDERIEQLNLELIEQKQQPSSDHEIQSKFTDIKNAYDALQTEQDDLLIMLSDQDNKVELYKNKLRELGHNILSDDEEIEEDNGLL